MVLKIVRKFLLLFNNKCPWYTIVFWRKTKLESWHIIIHIIIIYKIMATGSYCILKVKSKEQNIWQLPRFSLSCQVAWIAAVLKCVSGEGLWHSESETLSSHSSSGTYQWKGCHDEENCQKGRTSDADSIAAATSWRRLPLLPLSVPENLQAVFKFQFRIGTARISCFQCEELVSVFS